MIKVENLTKKFDGNIALHDINFEFPDTGIFYIVGPSGAGKSTFLKILAGTDIEYEGKVTINGVSLKEMDETRRKTFISENIGISFQSCLVSNQETVTNDLDEVLAIFNNKKEQNKSLKKYCLELVDMNDKVKSRGSTLSGGEKKRVSIAKAMLTSPNILLIDEPTGSLDEVNSKKVINVLKEYSKNHLVIVITHDRSLIEGESFVEFKDGVIATSNIIENQNSLPLSTTTNFKRVKRISFSYFLKNIFSSILYNWKLFSFSLLAMTISLTTFAFVFILSFGVSNGMTSVLSNNMSENTLKIDLNEQYDLKVPENIEEEKVKSIASDLSNYCISFGYDYQDDLNDIFDHISFSMVNENKIFTFKSITLDTINDYRPKGLFDKLPNRIKEKDLDYTEWILSLNVNDFNSVKTLFKVNTEEDLNNYLEANNVYLQFYASIESCNYYFEDLFPRIVYIIQGSETFLIHDDYDLNTKVLEGDMELDAVYAADAKFPWSIYKKPVVKVYDNRLTDFYINFAKNPNHSNVFPVIVEGNKNTGVSNVEFYYRQRDFLDVNDITSNYLKDESIKSISFNTGLYSYMGGGLYSGFLKSTFLSQELNLINDIKDANNISDVNLEHFQGSDIKVPSKVAKGTFSMNSKDNFSFCSDKNVKIVTGRKYEKGDEIVISKGLKNKLFPNSKDVINKTLHGTTISSIEEINKNEFRNIFEDFSLKVVGIADNEDLVIYQDEFFLNSLGFKMQTLNPGYLEINSMLIEFEDDADIKKIEQDLNHYTSNLKFSKPVFEIKKSIDSSIDKINIVMIIFSICSSIVSAFIFYYSIFILIQKEKPQIERRKLIGYFRSDILMYYFIYSTIITLVALGGSMCSTFVANIFLNVELASMFSITSTSLIPYLMMILLAFVINLIASLSINLVYRKKSLKNH